MFATMPDAEFGIPSGLSYPAGCRGWRYVLRGVQYPWAHAICASRKDPLPRIVLLDNLDQVAELFTSAPDLVVQQLQVLTPARINGGNRWKMEDVREFWVGRCRAGSGAAYRIVLEDGRAYCLDLFGYERDVAKGKLVFDASTSSAS